MKSLFFSFLFKYLNFFLKIVNRNKLKIFVYTDSRGYNVTSKIGKTPFESYVFSLCKKYNVSYYICPEKFTTIVDFIDKTEQIKNISSYDVVILHCGIVDFSPRPLSNIEKVKESKKGKEIFDNLFKKNESYHKKPFETYYYEEPTITIYSPEYLEKEILPKIEKINNLVWINSNNFVPNWEGNFTKGRPKNINETVNRFDEIISNSSRNINIISLKNWNTSEIKEFTIDNIHFTKKGFQKISNLIFDRINNLRV